MIMVCLCACSKTTFKKKAGKGKRKIVDPFSKKEWYTIKAPSVFTKTSVGYTLVNRTAGQRIASDALKGRVFTVNLADLQGDEDQGFRKIRLRCEEVKGKYVLTQFHGMDFTTDKLRSLIRKWQSLIEASVDVRTADGFLIRMFSIAFTKRTQNQSRRTSYAKGSQQKIIRKKMRNIMYREAASCELKDLVGKFIPESIGKQIEKECNFIYPLKDVFIRKVKILKAPRHNAFKFAELHANYEDDEGAVVVNAEPVEAEEEEEEETAAPVGDDK